MNFDKEFQIMFDLFCETNSQKIGQMTLAGVQAWFKDVGITGPNTNISESDVENAFKKSVQDESGITFAELKGMIGILAREKEMNVEEIISKLSAAGELQPDPSDNKIRDKNA
ncbi:hypothetical protein HNY73_019847 [Argiope bruennichi]|uniref:EF-hand domain-containing protein n=1 Tax=Argiope bruennichi TaxID=94029 RepID=A0A8T0E7E7_ARGBR|nr:hypothetical protein HNY73_019847 [Argiope bruennichi]